MSRKVSLLAELPALASAFRTVAEVEGALAGIERALARARDKRGVFASAYLLITRELEQRLARGTFEDDAWVASYLLRFANLYREALCADERSAFDLPEPWRVAFAVTEDPSVLMAQHLLLGINAHIAHDLPLALLDVAPDPRDPRRDSRYRDHTAINHALAEVTDAVEDRVCAFYGPMTSLLDLAGGPLDEILGGIALSAVRDAAWRSGIALIDATSSAAREQIRRTIELDAARTANLLLLPSHTLREAHRTLAAIESMQASWYEILADVGWGAPPDRPCRADLGRAALSSSTTDLAARIATWDAARDRAAAVGSVYLAIARNVERALADDEFHHLDWIAGIEAACIRGWLDAHHAHADGTTTAPRSWAVALAALDGSETLLADDLVLAMAVRLGHDLPLAVVRAGAAVDESHTADLTLLGTIVQHHVTRALAAITARYLRALPLETGVRECGARAALALDVESACRSVARTREESLGSAEIDRRATIAVHRIATRLMREDGPMTRVLRHHEEHATTLWSRWGVDEERSAIAHALGVRIDRLPTSLRAVIGDGGARRLRGLLDVAATPPLAWLHRLLPSVTERQAAPVVCDLLADGERDLWILGMNADRIVIELTSDRRGLFVREGLIEGRLDVDVLDEKLVVDLRGATMVGFHLPRAAAPIVRGTLAERNGFVVADVAIRWPFLGSLHVHVELEPDR